MFICIVVHVAADDDQDKSRHPNIETFPESETYQSHTVLIFFMLICLFLHHLVLILLLASFVFAVSSKFLLLHSIYDDDMA